MDKILLLRDEYSASSIETLKDSYKRFLSASKYLDSEQERRFIEDTVKIEELTTKNFDLKKSHKQEESTLSFMLIELENHNGTLKELEHEKTKLITENRLAECERDKIKAKCAMPNLRDMNLLERGRKKCEYYKNLTGIKWDYVMKSSAKGYVTNKQDYIHPFLYDLDDPKLVEKLWKEIAKCTASIKIK